MEVVSFLSTVHYQLYAPPSLFMAFTVKLLSMHTLHAFPRGYLKREISMDRNGGRD